MMLDRSITFAGILALAVVLVPATQVEAAPLLPPIDIQTFTLNGELTSSFEMASANEAGGLSIVIDDLGNDGTPEILLGGGFGNAPNVYIVREDGSEIGSFLAYAPHMGSGINLATCDLNNDGTKEIVTAPQRGGGPHVRVFSPLGEDVVPGGKFVYAEGFRGGVNIACGDLNGDGKDELVTMAGVGGGPHVRVWNMFGESLVLMEEFFAFDASHRLGVTGVIHNNKLSVISQRAHDKTLKVYAGSPKLALQNASTIAYDATGVSSLFMAGGDLHLSTTSNSQVLNVDTGISFNVESPFDSITAAVGDLNQDGTDEIVTVPYKPMFSEVDADLDRSIVVDLSDQRIFAYEKGVLTHTFLVGTARAGYTTPKGTHKVLAKPYLVHYAWSYGAGNANNYDLGFVPYNLRFFPHIYIHYAPWHNNFGRVISHGCVNVSLENIKWIYEWAQVDDQVVVRD